MKFFSTTFALLVSAAVSVSCRAVDHTLLRRDYPADFKPNFDSDFSVTIPKPISDVFRVLGTNVGLKDHILLSSIASDFQALTLDSVNIQGNIEDNFVRLAAAGSSSGALPRQGFKYKETIKIIPGISALDIVVNLEGTFTWDENRKVSLYETSSNQGVTVKKIRRFEEVPEGTKITEHIDGQCAFLQQPLVQITARKAHKEQMNLYVTLFK